ncbi:MAG TPA: hypothetical protein P5106_09255 [Caldisericia bacterium]|nr:hypothetical protein [Caldisericia bacterium]
MILICRDFIIRTEDEPRIEECDCEQIVVKSDCNLYYLWLMLLTRNKRKSTSIRDELSSMNMLLGDGGDV